MQATKALLTPVEAAAGIGSAVAAAGTIGTEAGTIAGAAAIATHPNMQDQIRL